jgi:hypothetical protein
VIVIQALRGISVNGTRTRGDGADDPTPAS